MSRKKFSLGLHTKEERDEAITMAKREYFVGFKTLEDSEGRAYPSYAIGYISAIRDLMIQEAPGDEDIQELDEMLAMLEGRGR